MFTYTIYKNPWLALLDSAWLFLLQREDINKKTLFKRLANSAYICLCTKWSKILGIGCLKQAAKRYLQLLDVAPEEHHTYWESGFFYTHPSYRKLGIGQHIQQKLIAVGHPAHIISVTRTDNLSMQHILERQWFADTKKTTYNAFLKQEVKIYLYR